MYYLIKGCLKEDCKMKVTTNTIKLGTKGMSDVVDITERLSSLVRNSGIKDGTLTAFVVGSTAGLTTIEYEPGLVHDINQAFERIAPKSGHYEHHERWGDDNGHSHVRASLLGPSLTIPIVSGKLPLGTWQQVILIDFDTRPRSREIIVQTTGL
jgi:secondary thiamine-phosphate synthase enzyme